MNQQVIQERKVETLVQAMRVLVAVIVVGAILGAAYLFVSNRSKANGEQAFALLFQAEKMEHVAAEEAQTLKSDTNAVMASWSPDKKKDFEDKLTQVIKAYPQSVAAMIAGLKLGRFEFGENKFAQAKDAYRGVLDRTNSQEHIVYRAMALEGLGSLLETEKNFDEARKTFDTAISLKDNPLKPLAYLGEARTLKSLGKTPEAKAAYEKVIQEFPGTPYAQKARVLLNAPQG